MNEPLDSTMVPNPPSKAETNVIVVPVTASMTKNESAYSRPPTNLSGRQKVAVILAHLGAHRAAPVLKELSDDEAISLTKEMVGLPSVSSAEVIDVLAEFMDRVSQPESVGQGGLKMAKEFLSERLGQARAQEIMDQIEGQHATGPLSGLLRVDPQQALAVLGAQQPQVVAVLLAYLPPEDAASLLSALEPAFRVKVAKRIAQLTRVDPVAVRQATTLLVGKLRNSESSGPTTLAGGTAVMAEILNHSDRTIEQQVLSELEQDDQALAEQIRSKLFTFDDVLRLDEKALQHIFRRLDAPTIALAIREPSLSPESLAKIRSNLSERVNTMVDEEIEVTGTVRGAQINAAQAQIVRMARQLDVEGVIVIARDNEVVG
ncbi:MAG TPA: flagellar motor switch protein FliG [Acidimicrobiales bacterium]|nr:flagellar motor switch protein FliG [Acidimicrobiales bacterium]